ncbi:MAG: hypothetical protein II979_08675, partial [Clostridia bacterium]|nr:hypothetical protein [Clostridia bacterium]
DVFAMKNIQAENLTVTADNAGTLFGQLTGGSVEVQNGLLINAGESVADAAASVDATDCYANYDDDNFLARTDAELTDIAAKDAMKGFDFDNVWMARAGKTPVLRLAKSADDVEAGIVETVEPAAGAADAVATAPQTFDMGIVAAASAIVAAAGYMLTKKR